MFAMAPDRVTSIYDSKRRDFTSMFSAGGFGCQESQGASEKEECAENFDASGQALRLFLHRS